NKPTDLCEDAAVTLAAELPLTKDVEIFGAAIAVSDTLARLGHLSRAEWLSNEIILNAQGAGLETVVAQGELLRVRLQAALGKIDDVDKYAAPHIREIDRIIAANEATLDIKNKALRARQERAAITQLRAEARARKGDAAAAAAMLGELIDDTGVRK